MTETHLPDQSTTEPPPEYYAGFKHAYHLENRGVKWLQLFVETQRKSPSPIFREGQPITGSVEIDLDKAETVKSITIQVQAGTTSVGQEEIRFLEITESLWTPSKTSGKLNGRHSWPFRILLPGTVHVSSAKGNKEYKLPPNFTEKASTAYIDYRLVVTVKRGALRVNQTLTANFAYLPHVVPGPLSELRQLAYSERLPLAGPELDPEGWKLLSPVVLKGTLFDVQKVEVECTLGIAKPVSFLVFTWVTYGLLTFRASKLCYAPGSPLPLHLTLTSDNTQALDVLSVPDAIRLCLIRSLGIGSDAHESAIAGRSSNLFASYIGQAVFWASGAQGENKRELEGELEVPSNLKPSFVFPRFTVRYRLELLPFSAVGFRVSDLENNKTLLLEQVTIATQQTPGIIPWSNIPPGYKPPEVVDYNSTVGFLENGNQRFWHHGAGFV